MKVIMDSELEAAIKEQPPIVRARAIEFIYEMNKKLVDILSNQEPAKSTRKKNESPGKIKEDTAAKIVFDDCLSKLSKLVNLDSETIIEASGHKPARCRYMLAYLLINVKKVHYAQVMRMMRHGQTLYGNVVSRHTSNYNTKPEYKETYDKLVEICK